MQKKILYILLFISAFFLWNIENAKADKTIINTNDNLSNICRYQTDSSVEQKYQRMVTCKIFKDNSHTCCVGDNCSTTAFEFSSAIKISNWNKEKKGTVSYNPGNGKCPSYLVYIIENVWGTKNLWAFDNLADAETKKNQGDEAFLSKGFLLNATELTVDEKLLIIQQGIKKVNEDYSYENCSMITSDRIDDIQNVCIRKIGESQTKLANYKNQFQRMINSGEANANSSIALRIDELITDTENYLSTEHKRLRDLAEASDLISIQQIIKGIQMQYDISICKKHPSNLTEKAKKECKDKLAEIQNTIKYYKNEVQKLKESGKISENNEFANEVINLIQQSESKYSKESENYTKTDTPDKCILFGERVDPMLKWIIRLIQIAIPVIIIVMSIIDFMGIVFSGEDKNFKAAGSKLVKRLIIGAVIIFLPMIIIFIIDFSGALAPYGIERNQIFCSLF